jgi:aminoglycoside 2''-phosphotransferase
MQRDPWHNDFPLDPTRVAEIIAADLPEFHDPRVSVLGEGWDFSTFLVDDEWVFRFPKRRQCVRQLAREFKLLEALADPLSRQQVAIPRYRFHVQTPVLSKVAYVGYALLRGEALIECPIDSIDRAAIGRQLGGFLKRLHKIAPTPRPRAYHDQFPSDLIDFRRELDESAAALPPSIAAACAEALAHTPVPDDQPPQFQHCDLGAEHILVDRDRNTIVAIIDWGDAGWGNRVADLVGLWAWGGDAGVLAALPAWDQTLRPDDWARLRQWGIAYAIGCAYYGYKDRRDPLHATALGWLERIQKAGQLANPGTPDV